MVDLWKSFEEEKNKAMKEKEAVAEFYNKAKEEYESAMSTISACYLFNYFIKVIYPEYIQILLKKYHKELRLECVGEKTTLPISIGYELRDSFDYFKMLENAGYSLDDLRSVAREVTYCFAYKIKNSQLNIAFREDNDEICDVFAKKLYSFLRNNNLMNQLVTPETLSLGQKLIYEFNASIPDLIKAYYNGLQQIIYEEDALKELMDTYQITFEQIINTLGIRGGEYVNFVSEDESLKR